MATDAARLGKARTGERAREQEVAEKQGQPLIQRAWQEREGLWGFLTTAQSRRIAQRQVVVSFLFFLLGGVNAALIRFQLAQPNNDLVTPQQYNQLFTMHGSTMMFLFAVPFMLGAALLLLPLVLGAREVPWPRLTAFVFWSLTIGGLLFEASWLFGAAPDAGWTASPPLTEKVFSPGPGLDFWLLPLMMISIGGILACAVLITTVFTSRAPGMTLGRMPLLAWAVLTVGGVMFFAFVVMLCAAAFLEFDRKFGTHFFDPGGGGSPLLWQYLFWFFGHPAVYLQFVLAAGLASMILPVIVRQRLVGYSFLAPAIVLTGLLTFGLWMDHTVLAALNPLGIIIFAGAAVLFGILAAVQVSALAVTIWRGAGKWNTPYLFVLGFLFLFILGAIAGILLALYPFGVQADNSFFAVAHLHYYLFGALVFPLFAAFYYWFPKFKGRFLDERLGKWNFWLMFVGFNIAFFPMFLSGLLGMPRRLYTYPSSPELNVLNLVSTAGAVVLVTGVLFFLVNMIVSLVSGRPAGANPWGADSLEWATDSPVPPYGFQRIPIVQTRHPLWDQERLDTGSESTVRLAGRLAEWPATWRAALVTSARAGQPEEVYRVAGPSIWPLAAAIGLALVFISFFFDQLVFAGVLLAGVIVLVVSLIGWHRPAREQGSAPAAEFEEFEKLHGVPVYLGGSPAAGLWATVLAILGLAAALAVAIFSYFYLRSNAAAWPPDGIQRPDSYVPLIATAVLAASELLALAGLWGARNDRSGLSRLALAAAFLLGLGFVVLQVRGNLLLPLTPATDAYGSILYAAGFLITLIAVVGLVILLGTQTRSWRGARARLAAYAVRNAVLFWTFVVVAWLVVLVTLYLAT